MNRNTQAIPQLNPLISRKKKKARLEFVKKCRGEPRRFRRKVLWTDETKINFDQSDEKVLPNSLDDIAHDGSSKLTIKASKLIGRSLIVQQGNHPKHIST